jgi:8-oxo-dGTP pyrophosphatase MutT (NUDIX family)
MENGETTSAAAARETLEEANARVAIGELYSMHNVPYINQVHLLYRSKLLDLDFSPGVESLEVVLFLEKDIPWETIAFRPVKFTLQRYFADRKKGSFNFFNSDLAPPLHRPDDHS